MKKWEIYFLELLLFICMIVFTQIIRNPYLLDLSIILISIYFIARFGMMKDNNYTQKIVTRIVISSILVYLLTIYMIGLLTGFHHTVFSFNGDYLLRIIGLGTIVIVLEEIVRYIICRNTPHQKLPVLLYAFVLSCLNIILEINGLNLADHEALFIFATTVVLPIISREAVCSYITYKVSYKPSIVFKLSLYLYELVLPIIPSLGNYLYAVANIALPYGVYFFVGRLSHYQDKQEIYQKQTIRRLFYIPAFTFLLILVFLVSGFFTHTMISIGSNSMKPTYCRGDAVVYQKKAAKNVEIGEILVFKKEGIIVTHRVMNIEKIDSHYQFQTKGDANKTPDSFKVKDEEVLGVVKYSVKYIGYPTLWFHDVFIGEETSG